MAQRVCSRCKTAKPDKDFYDRVNRSWCRKCTRKYAIDWRIKNADKRSAHKLVAWALRWGKLKRPDKCSKCHRLVSVIAHHEDYDKPLKVKWLCDSCHAKRHHQLRTEALA